MEKFRKSRDIILRQIRKERIHYPYRVASEFQQFFDRFANQLQQDDLNEIGLAVTQILDRINGLPDSSRRNRYIIECKKTTEYILSRKEDIEKK
jgi:hypothetical protein